MSARAIILFTLPRHETEDPSSCRACVQIFTDVEYSIRSSAAVTRTPSRHDAWVATQVNSQQGRPRPMLTAEAVLFSRRAGITLCEPSFTGTACAGL